MPEPEQIIDFRAFTVEVAATVKPDYADVVARAARRRRRRSWFGASFTALAVLLGGGTAYALTADRTPPPAKPAVIKPWRTIVPPGGEGPKPGPSYHEIEPGFWDPTKPDVPLAGGFPTLQAGDLNHLYMSYQDCRSKPCTAMLAVSSDRGRTWRKLPLPAAAAGQYPTGVTLVHGTTVLASASPEMKSGTYRPEDIPEPSYWVSRDAGATWNPARVRAGGPLPHGAPWRPTTAGTILLDPATGEVVRMERDRSMRRPDELEILANLPNGQLWAQQQNLRINVKVSLDGGLTWEERKLPNSPNLARRQLYIASDGRTLYAADRLRDSVKLKVSGDGGRTWAARAEVDLDGPLLGLLPVDDRVVIVQGSRGSYRSTDQGQTFTKVGPEIGARPEAVPGGFHMTTNNNEYSAWNSPDGAEWTYIRRPEIP